MNSFAELEARWDELTGELPFGRSCEASGLIQATLQTCAGIYGRFVRTTKQSEEREEKEEP